MTSQTKAAEFKEQLLKKRWEYWCSLPERLSDIAAVTSQVAEKTTNRTSLRELYNLLHRLVGSAGTLGQPSLSEAARGYEQAVKALLSEDRPLAETDRELIQSIPPALSAVVAEPDQAQFETIEARPSVGLNKALIWVLDPEPAEFAALERQLSPFNYQLRHISHPMDEQSLDHSPKPQLVIVNLTAFYNNLATRDSLKGFCRALEERYVQTLFLADEDRFDWRVFSAKLMGLGFLLKPLSVPKLTARIDQALAKAAAPPERVMIVDDDRALAEHYQWVLESAGMRVSILENLNEIMTELERFIPELVLMDLHMPEYSGTELAAVIRQYDRWESLPIVYLSAETDMAEQIRAMRFGADDFLSKPVVDAQLVAAVHARIERARRLSDQITKDSLTGLLRHASIKEHVVQEVHRAVRDQQSLSVAMIDIDHFKSVNDTYGHPVGDLVISSLAMLLRQRVRLSDIVGRYGGEEFAVILPRCTHQCAQTILNNIRELFSRIEFDHLGTTFRCTLSAGVATLSENSVESGNNGHETAEQVLASADAALYRAKKAGRNRVY